MEIGCCSDIFNLNILERAGYDFIELAGSKIARLNELEFARVQKLINDSTIKCKGFNAFLPADIKITGPGIDSKQIKDYLKVAYNRGSALGISVTGIGSPLSRTIPDGFDREKAREQIKEFLKIASETSSKYSISVLLEPLNSCETNLINTIDEGAGIVEELSIPHVGLLIDYYHLIMQKEDINKLTHSIIKLTKHIHLAEEKRRFPFVNNLDKYNVFIRKLCEQGYKGDISIEATSENIEQDAKLALKLLRTIIHC